MQKTRSHGTLTSSHSTMASVSSSRQVSGLSNSLTALGSIGLRDHRLKPSALHGMAQVIAWLAWSGASGMTLPIQISSAMTAPVASIFMPEMTTPSSSSRTTWSVGTGRFCLW